MKDYTLYEDTINRDFIQVSLDSLFKEKYDIQTKYKDRELKLLRKELLDWQNSPYTEKEYLSKFLVVSNYNDCVQIIEVAPPVTIVNNYNVNQGENLSFVTNELVSGIKDGVNTTFTTINIPINDSLMLFINGVLQLKNIDYFLSGSTITLVLAPYSSDTITVSYFK